MTGGRGKWLLGFLAVLSAGLAAVIVKDLAWRAGPEREGRMIYDDLPYKQAVAWCEGQGGTLTGWEGQWIFQSKALRGTLRDPRLREVIRRKEAGEEVSTAVRFLGEDPRRAVLINAATSTRLELDDFEAVAGIDFWNECQVPR